MPVEQTVGPDTSGDFKGGQELGEGIWVCRDLAARLQY